MDSPVEFRRPRRGGAGARLKGRILAAEVIAASRSSPTAGATPPIRFRREAET